MKKFITISFLIVLSFLLGACGASNVVKAKEDGSYSILPDQMVGTKYYNGMYDAKTDQVWFRISEYVQDLVLAGPDAENYGLFLYTYAGSNNAKRWILHGPGSQDTTNRIKLEII